MRKTIMWLAVVLLAVASGVNVLRYLNERTYIDTIEQETKEQDEKAKAMESYREAMKDLKRTQEDLERSLGR